MDMNTASSLQLDIYINYPGICEKAFRFYEEHLGGTISMMMPHPSPPPHFPKEWQQPILHAIITIGGMLVRGADVVGAEPMRSAYLTLRLGTPEKAEHIYPPAFPKWRRFYEAGKNLVCQPLRHAP